MNGVKRLSMNCQLEMDSCATRLVLHEHEKTMSNRKQCVTTHFCFQKFSRNEDRKAVLYQGKKIKEKRETHVCTYCGGLILGMMHSAVVFRHVLLCHVKLDCLVLGGSSPIALEER